MRCACSSGATSLAKSRLNRSATGSNGLTRTARNCLPRESAAGILCRPCQLLP